MLDETTTFDLRKIGQYDAEVLTALQLAGRHTKKINEIIDILASYSTGLKGDKGDKGDTGANGATGLQGEKGDTGLTGATGAQGIQGIKGDKGDVGLAGATGAQGIQGIQGLQGLQGIQGIQGEKGDAGVSTGNATEIKNIPVAFLPPVSADDNKVLTYDYVTNSFILKNKASGGGGIVLTGIQGLTGIGITIQNPPVLTTVDSTPDA